MDHRVAGLRNPPSDVLLRNRLGLLCLEAEAAAERLSASVGDRYPRAVTATEWRALAEIVAELRDAVRVACLEPAPVEPLVLRDAYGDEVPDGLSVGNAMTYPHPTPQPTPKKEYTKAPHPTKVPTKESTKPAATATQPPAATATQVPATATPRPQVVVPTATVWATRTPCCGNPTGVPTATAVPPTATKTPVPSLQDVINKQTPFPAYPTAVSAVTVVPATPTPQPRSNPAPSQPQAVVTVEMRPVNQSTGPATPSPQVGGPIPQVSTPQAAPVQIPAAARTQFVATVRPTPDISTAVGLPRSGGVGVEGLVLAGVLMVVAGWRLVRR